MGLAIFVVLELILHSIVVLVELVFVLKVLILLVIPFLIHFVLFTHCQSSFLISIDNINMCCF